MLRLRLRSTPANPYFLRQNRALETTTRYAPVLRAPWTWLDGLMRDSTTRGARWLDVVSMAMLAIGCSKVGGSSDAGGLARDTAPAVDRDVDRDDVVPDIACDVPIDPMIAGMDGGDAVSTDITNGGNDLTSGLDSGPNVVASDGATAEVGEAFDPYVGVGMQPDTDPTPVPSCTGQPDMTLCNVVTTPDRWYDICVGGLCVSPGCGDASCNPPAPHFPIPPNSYHAHLQPLPGSEPVVVDLVTGLHWQGCDAGRSGSDCSGNSTKSMTWADALAYCDGLTWAGKSDWYLPDSWELMSILDWSESGGSSMALDPKAFPRSQGAYWSSHFQHYQSFESDTNAYVVQFSSFRGPFSTIFYQPATETSSVRCVRRGFSRNAAYVGARFTVGTSDSDKTVSDLATGLEWQGCAAGRSGTTCSGQAALLGASDAVAYCDSLSWAGSTDWRLPTYKELQSIVQYAPLSGSDYAFINKSFFDVTNGDDLACRTGWTATAQPLLIRVAGGGREAPDASSTYPTICVRNTP